MRRTYCEVCTKTLLDFAQHAMLHGNLPDHARSRGPCLPEQSMFLTPKWPRYGSYRTSLPGNVLYRHHDYWQLADRHGSEAVPQLAESQM